MDSDRIEGNLKEAEGKITGDEELEREGEAQDAWGKAKDSADDAWEKTKDAADERAQRPHARSEERRGGTE